MTWSIRRMTEADVPRGMELTAQAGWNQTSLDWLRCLALEPDGCFVWEEHGLVVGTVTACRFGPVAWIGLVLVDAAYRRRGIATALMEHALTYLVDGRVETVRLDATPLGRPVYEKLGFVAEYELTRYEGVWPKGADPALSPVEAADRAFWPELAAWDRAATATDRLPLLDRLFTEQPTAVRLLRGQGTVEGFSAGRPGRLAWQVGPCVARDEAAGILLLRDALSRQAGQSVFLDVPTANEAARRFLEEHGWRPQRMLLRMRRGKPLRDNLALMWSCFGPEKG
ncbi:MAG: GNAT family N-acetyltransferase [Gemmataceae bacterium]|nr:GNAT family N-acetyltransferase [Gemmataceae bacterium]MDW8266164.1 GNAT family N-acetyltransferase [Gemmataceae bacterium]